MIRLNYILLCLLLFTIQVKAQTIANIIDTLNKMPADSWYELSNSSMTPTLYPAVFGDGIYANSGPSAITNAWGGGAYDKNNNRFFIWGGGHGDYAGNEIYVFKTDSFIWYRLTDPSSGTIASSDNTDPLSDGKPASRHTYGGMAFIDNQNNLFECGGGISITGGGTNLTWIFNPINNMWDNRQPTGSIPPSIINPYCFSAAYDAITGNVFMRDLNYMYWYEYASNNWTRSNVNCAVQSFSSGACIVPNKRLYLRIGNGQLFVYNVLKDSLENWALLPNQVNTIGTCSGIAYDSIADEVLVIKKDSLWALNLNTKLWTQKTYSITPSSLGVDGPFGRWQYLSSYNVFMLVPSTSSNVYFYKNKPGPGTIFPTAVNSTFEKTNFSIYPNPNNGNFTVACKQACEGEIFNCMGKKIETVKLTKGESKISFSYLPSGLYAIKTKTSIALFTIK